MLRDQNGCVVDRISVGIIGVLGVLGENDKGRRMIDFDAVELRGILQAGAGARTQ